ncbi:MAG: hypothetical protein KF693_13365 [Nitrospira sp.]|nr:hypothetical protein [Nitrospira sp.]
MNGFDGVADRSADFGNLLLDVLCGTSHSAGEVFDGEAFAGLSLLRSGLLGFGRAHNISQNQKNGQESQGNYHHGLVEHD